MSITVREALNIGKLRESKVIAGKDGLDRFISYIDILEVPDVTSWIRAQVLLLTTGYAIKEKPDIQVKLIEQLATKGAAGLIIKENRFLKTIPNRMIEKADELKIPIIVVPADIPYIEITHPLLNEILKRQNEEYNVQEKFKELVKNSEKFSEEKIKNLVRQIKNIFKAEPPYVISLITFEKYSNLKKYIDLNNIKQSSNILASIIDGNFLLIYSLGSNSEMKICEFLNNSFTNESKLKCIISDKIYGLQKIYPIYKNLLKCLPLIDKIPWFKHNVIYYKQICHYMLLEDLSKQLKSYELIKNVLRPLDKLENNQKETLVKTLYYYVKNGGNKTKAAEECYVHRNTFNYRMKKIEQILESSLDDPEEIYKYRLVLDLYFMGNRGKLN